LRCKNSVVLISGLVGVSALILSVVSGAESAPNDLASLNDDVLSAFINDANQTISKYLPLILFSGAGLVVAYSFLKFPDKKKVKLSRKGARPKRPRRSSRTTVAVTDFNYQNKSNDNSSETLDSDHEIPERRFSLQIEAESDVITEARVFSSFGRRSQAIWMLLSYLSNKEDKPNEVITELIDVIKSELNLIKEGDVETTELHQQISLFFKLVKFHRHLLSKATIVLFNESFSEYHANKSVSLKLDSYKSKSGMTEIKSKRLG
jgi:hypothetical protein